MEQLPDEMLAEILARLPPSSLAASRCVSKHWCCIVDDRRLLRAHLLPLRLEALYCISLDNIDQLTYLFARPSAARRIPGGCLDFLEDYQCLEVNDHCNGLLLVYDDTVVNPATRQWAALPYAPEPSIDHMLGVAAVWAAAAAHQEKDDGYYPTLSLSIRFYLVYDPMAESPQHFEVFLIPLLMGCRDALLCDDITIDLEEQEWPPSTFRTHVFSSRRWRWEERSWIRQGEPAGTMADMLRSENCRNRKAVYFRGALYVHYQNDAVMRISLSKNHKNTYQMMRLPATRSKPREELATVYLGKSEKGVYCALLQYDNGPQFRVWLLREEEMNGQIHMEWLLKTNISLGPLVTKLSHRHHDSLAPDEWRIIRNRHDYDPAASSAHDAEWNFDNAHGIVLEEAANNAKHWYPVDFLGFHPYKEIVFFSLSWKTISYNLNTSKIQLVGGKAYIPVGIKTCFPYTPCWLTMKELAVDHPSPAT